MAYGESIGQVTEYDRVQHLENSWRCYLVTIVNYYSLLWFEAARSAILQRQLG